MAAWLIGVLGIMFLAGCARFNFQQADYLGRLGFVVLFSSWILTVIIGCRAAMTQQAPMPRVEPERDDEKPKPGCREDELA